jgi:hypothetical protein
MPHIQTCPFIDKICRFALFLWAATECDSPILVAEAHAPQRFGKRYVEGLLRLHGLLCQAILRYVWGVLPVQCRKARWNAVGSSKPTS